MDTPLAATHGVSVMRSLLRIVAGGSSSVDPSRLVWILAIFKAGLWLATGLASALLVYWLHFKPVYEEDWTATIGSVVCAGLALYAVIGCLNNLNEVFAAFGKSHRPLQR
jgi:hypothetical protein